MRSATPSTHRRCRRHGHFNPRTPCGVRRNHTWFLTQIARFQSTHSMRSATRPRSRPPARVQNFNPRTPCGVRRSLHQCVCACALFQSTHSMRSATISWRSEWLKRRISIHALHAECDFQSAVLLSMTRLFQSTHSMRSATSM